MKYRVTVEIETTGASIGDVQNLARAAVEARSKRARDVFPNKITAIRIVSAHAEDDSPAEA